MQVQVLFFGATADITGQRRVEAEISFETAANEVFEQLISQHPQLAMHRLHFSINEEYATGEEILMDGDELAVFTAVSGG